MEKGHSFKADGIEDLANQIGVPADALAETVENIAQSYVDVPMGRKMDFLIQEVNRESNTIGSKCNDVAIANVVVGLKAEVEKMREQVQNVE